MFYLYQNLHALLVILLLYTASAEPNNNLIIDKIGVDPVIPDSVGIQYFVVLNNTSEDGDFDVEVTPDVCCLENPNENKDCASLDIFGSHVGVIPRKTSKIARFVSPILDPFGRKGYCIAYVDSKEAGNKYVSLRNKIKIKFNTNVNDFKPCKKVDEDPLNDCKPVDCDVHYNGKKSFYDKKRKRCVKVKPCVGNGMILQDIVYDPRTNFCINGQIVRKRDIEFVKKKVKKGLKARSRSIYSNITKYFPNDLEKEENILSSAMSFANMVPIAVLVGKGWSISFLGIIVFVQCCLLIGLLYYFSGACGCNSKKKLTRNFYNYRQDVTDTTPLICTSNVDTDTTEFHFMSESSNNNERNVKSYKSIQKDNIKNEVLKKCHSDDILTKCLNRRDWSRKTKGIPENVEDIEKNPQDKAKECVNIIENAGAENNRTKVTKKSADKIVFENEKSKSKSTNFSKSVRKYIRESDDIDNKDSCSEKEIICHSYEELDKYVFSPSRVNIFPHAPHFQSKMINETSAQANFPKDSIDDLISEKAQRHLIDGSICRESYSDDLRKISSSGTSKNSRNNSLKSVFSSLLRRSKTTSKSEPAGNKSSDIDLKLLHMSKNSICSSSINEAYLRNMKSPNGSRTSL